MEMVMANKLMFPALKLVQRTVQPGKFISSLCCVKFCEAKSPLQAHHLRDWSAKNGIEIAQQCSADVLQKIAGNLRVLPDFISEEEEQRLVDEVQPRLKRMRYEFDHWDDAIHGFRETEKLQWSPENTVVIERLKAAAFPKDASTLKMVHVLDLSENGVIKPHIDSIKFCGDTISGISLLSNSVMKLVHHEKPEIYVKVLLPRRSLYIMKDFVRYDMTHEILDNANSFIFGEKIVKTRRVSVICRSEPPSGLHSSPYKDKETLAK